MHTDSDGVQVLWLTWPHAHVSSFGQHNVTAQPHTQHNTHTHLCTITHMHICTQPRMYTYTHPHIRTYVLPSTLHE